MTIEEFVKILKIQNGKDTELRLQGIIDTNIKIESVQIRLEENKLFLENDFAKIGLNLNQLMKINQIRENEILLEFDQLQNVMIRIIKK